MSLFESADIHIRSTLASGSLDLRSTGVKGLRPWTEEESQEFKDRLAAHAADESEADCLIMRSMHWN